MKKTSFPYGLIYGPHASRRLGLSLGVDLTPMSCTFNCVYCERGSTLYGYRNQQAFTSIVDLNQFVDVLKQRIAQAKNVDCLTFSGTGEPTLEKRLGEFIASARKIIGSKPIKVITNSSQLISHRVIQNLAEADEVIAKLNAVSDNTFAEIHRPFDPTLKTARIIKGLIMLQKEIGRKLTIEILFIRSYQPVKTNATLDEVEQLTRVLHQISPAKLQIHTINRVPAEPYILPVTKRFLHTASTYMKNRFLNTHVVTFL